ncbi:hypothetical protein JCM8547_002508 [Rhodosporidiobolus lusitaniae]
MPPRRKAAQSADALDPLDSNQPVPSTRRSLTKQSSSTSTTSSRSTRTTRTRASTATQQDEPEEDNEEPPKPARVSRTAAGGISRSTTASTARRSAANAAKPISTASSTATTTSRRSAATQAASAASRARRSARVSEAATVPDEQENEQQEEEEDEEEEEEEEEEEVVKPRSRRAPASSRTSSTKKPSSASSKPASKTALRSPPPHVESSSDDDEEEEEEQAKKQSASKGKKRVSLATRSPVKPVRKGEIPSEVDTETETEEEHVEEEQEEEDEQGSEAETEVAPADAPAPAPNGVDHAGEDEDEEDAEMEQTPQPVTPQKKKNKRAPPAKNSKRAVVQDSDDEETEEADAAPPAAEEENAAAVEPKAEDGDAAALPPSAQRAPPSPSSPVKPLPPAPTPPPTALTASALASIARQAALDHSLLAAQHAKEMEGKPRLVIHQLVLENFKSYRGRGVIGPFHKSFSSIVGPNGSGKSNTIDALLFVFGFRASKMRQGRFSELIHNSGPSSSGGGEDEDGSEGEEGMEEDSQGFEDSEEEDESEEDLRPRGKKGAKGGKGGKRAKGKTKKGNEKDASYSAPPSSGGCDFATVEVWFREVIDLPGNRDDFTVVPNSQLVVARTVRKDNSTKYTVNGKTTTAGEVKQLLLGRGIDLTHNRFLILQGEVESIAQMPPKGRTEHEEGLLEYLEDIIGTASYKPEIESALVEVERMGEERGVVMSRVKLVEKEKGALEDRKKSADAYLRDQVLLVSSQSRLYQRHAHQAQADKGLYEHQLAEAGRELEEELSRQSEDRKRYEEGVEAVRETERGLKEIEEAAAALGKELAAFEKAKVQLSVQKKAADTKFAKLKKALEEDKHARSAAESAIRDSGDALEGLVEKKEQLKDELELEQATLNQLMAGLKDKVAPLNAQIEENQRLLAPWQEQIEAKSNETKIASQQLADVRNKASHAQEEIERVEKEMEALQELQATKIGEMRELRRRQKEGRKALEEVKGRVGELRKEEQRARVVAQGAREKTVEAKASQSASVSKGQVLTAVQKLKDQGRLPGFHGRLGDLGRIDDVYDIAISTAASAGLESLVVDTRETAESIFDHLRKHNIGRASCIALDRFPSNVDLAPIQCPRGTERLFDLVTPKEARYAPVFRHVLKNTLVARDWDTASAVSQGKVDGSRWRVVTTDGNVAEASGAAQVGGSRPVRGKMSSKLAADEVSPKQLMRLEQEEVAAVGELEEVGKALREVEGVLKELEKEMSGIEVSIPKVEMDLEANKKDAEEKVALLEELQSQSEPDAADVKRAAQLEKTISTLEGDLEALRTKASKFSDAIASLEDQIREVGGIKFRTAEAKVSDLQDQIRLTDARLVKAKTDKAKGEKDLAKLTKAIEGNAGKSEELEAEIKELKQRLKENEDEAEPVRQTVGQAQAKVEEGREELANLKGELEEQEEAIIEFRKAEAHLGSIFNDVDRKLKETTRIFDHWAAKLGELEMPEFELLDDHDSDNENDGEKEDGEPRQRAPKIEDVLRVLDADEIEAIDVKRLKADIALLEERLEKNTADLAVLQEYKRREDEFRKRGEEFEAISKEWDAAKNQVTELRNERLVKFMKGFGIISNKLKEMYQMITLGGNAELELYDSADPFSEGIVFSVMPPKKSWKNISNLSGGEKTLSSLALVFALHTYKPTPLYFMDEIDAALDFRNVSIVANYIKEKTHGGAQFIIISLRNNMFELAARLVGIYKVDNQTRSVCIDNKELAEISSIDVDDEPTFMAVEEEQADEEEEAEDEPQDEEDA